MGRIGSEPAGKIESLIRFANDIRDLGRQQRPRDIHWRSLPLTGIKRPSKMVGWNTTRATGVLGLCVLSGCHGGLTLNALVLLVTVSIFIGTILLERSS